MTRPTLAMSAAWDWTLHGWELFMRQPAFWIGMSLLYLLCLLLVRWIPVLGQPASLLLGTLLFAGFLFTAHDLEHDRPPRISQLFAALRDTRLGLRLLQFGLLPVLTGLLHQLLLTLGLGGALLSLFMLAASLAIAAAWLFGLPLTCLAGRAPLPAMRASLQICATELPAVAVLLALALLGGLLAVIPFALGLVVFLPVMAGAIHTAYRQLS